MKLSRKICDCAQSPIRKFYPYAVAAQQRGIRIHQLNIGQPDIQTPPAFFEAIEAGRRDVLAYAESPGIPALLEAIRAYYARIGASKLIFGPSTTNTPCFFRSFALLKRACTFFMLLFDALVIIFFSFYIDDMRVKKYFAPHL